MARLPAVRAVRDDHIVPNSMLRGECLGVVSLADTVALSRQAESLTRVVDESTYPLLHTMHQKQHRLIVDVDEAR